MAPCFHRSFSTPAVVDDVKVQKVASERHEGVITRICNFKYGFIQTVDLRNIFFHFSELSDEAKAFVEEGCKVTCSIATSAKNQQQAQSIVVESTPGNNQFKNKAGVVQRDLGPKGFGFITCDSVTYFFAANELIIDAASTLNGDTARAGDKVIFDATWNHKYNPPKPCATRVRLQRSSTSSKRSTSPTSVSNFETRATPGSRSFKRAASMAAPATGNGSSENDQPPSVINSRAVMLKRAAAPKRLGSRTVSKGDEEQAISNTEASIAETQAGRISSSTAALSVLDEGDNNEGFQSLGSGMSTLKVLVRALLNSGKTQYLVIRNELQKSEYFGRALTQEEKRAVTDILNDHQKQMERYSRSNSNSSYSGNSSKYQRSSSRGGGVRRMNSRGPPQKQNSRAAKMYGRADSHAERPPVMPPVGKAP